MISTRENYLQCSEIYWSSEDEDEYDETSVDIKHENMKSSGGNDFYKAHEKTENKLMSAEDAEVGRDATCLSPGNEESSSHFSKDEDGSPVLKKIVHSTSTTSSSREGGLHLDEYSRNNSQPTEADGGIGEKQEDRKDIGNDESTKNDKVKRSGFCTCNPDQQESDDPRKGGKICFERTRNINASGISNIHEQNYTPEVRILDDTTHTSTGKLSSNRNAVSSIIRILSKKSHDLVSSFISRPYTERESGTAASTDSEESKNDKINIRK